MGTLLTPDAARIALGRRTVLGRAETADVVVADPRVSAAHASLTWEEPAWFLRDLGSRNGTFVGGERLAPGARVALRRGDRVGVAGADGGFVLVDDAPPRTLAVPIEGDPVTGSEDLLVVPPGDTPELVVLRTPVGWVAEQGGATTPVASGERRQVGDRWWRLELPPPGDVSPTLGMDSGPTLGFRVSPDEEVVELELWQAGGLVQKWGGKRHLYLLLTLARLRRASVDDSGWVDLEDLAHMLRMAPKTVDVHVHRARTDVVGHDGLAGRLVERRPGTRLLRLGLPVAWIRVE